MNIKPVASAALVAALSSMPDTGKADTVIFGGSPGTTGVHLILNGSLSIGAANTGWYTSAGFHDTGNTNYVAGLCCNVNPPDNLHNDYFVFNLSGVTGTITSATLSIVNPTNGYHTDTNATDAVFSTWNVTTAISTLESSQSTATSISSDLGSGTLFGSVSVGPSDNNSVVNISLDGAALTAITAAKGSLFAIGGSLTWTDGVVAGVPEPSTWTMMLLGFFGIGFLAYRKKSTPRLA